MENKKLLELNDDALNAVSGGTDVGHKNCADFRCYFCGHQKTDPAEYYHFCTEHGFNRVDYCNYCDHLCNCSRAVDYRTMEG